jgi:hypothetical protein
MPQRSFQIFQSCFDGNGLTCSARDFFHMNFFILPLVNYQISRIFISFFLLDFPGKHFPLRQASWLPRALHGRTLSLSESTTYMAWTSLSTLFAPTDSSVLACDSCSFDFHDLNSMTVFVVDDLLIFTGYHSYSRNARFHIRFSILFVCCRNNSLSA